MRNCKVRLIFLATGSCCRTCKAKVCKSSFSKMLSCFLISWNNLAALIPISLIKRESSIALISASGKPHAKDSLIIVIVEKKSG